MSKKFFNFIIAICLIIPCCLGFVACKKPKDPPKDFSEHESFVAMIEDVITTFAVKDKEETEPQTFGFVNSASPVSTGNESLLDELIEELEGLNSHELKGAKTWFEAMCTSVFTYPLGASDALKTTFKEENLYNVVMEIYSFVEGEQGAPAVRETRKMVIQSLSDTHKAILIAGENTLVRCDLNYYSEGNFNFEYIDIEYTEQGGIGYIDYCYGDSSQNVVEVYASERSNSAVATWFDGLTCREYNGAYNDIIDDCIEEIVEHKNPAQYRAQMQALYNGAHNYSIFSDDLYEFMVKYLEDVWAAQEEDLGPFYSYINDGCLYGIPSEYNEPTIVLPDDIDSVRFGLTVPECVTKIIFPDNVKYIKESVANYNQFARRNGWPESTEPEHIDNGEGILNINYIEVPVEYVNQTRAPFILTSDNDHSTPDVPFAGEIQFTENSELLKSCEFGLQLNLKNLAGENANYMFRVNDVEEFLNEIIPSEIVINTSDYDFTSKADDRYGLKINLFDSNGGFVVEMEDGDMRNVIQEDKDLYDQSGNKIMRFDFDEQKMYIIEGNSETWLYDYKEVPGGGYPKANINKIKETYTNLCPVMYANINVKLTENCIGSYNYDYNQDGQGVMRLGFVEDYDEGFDAPQTLTLDFYNETLKDNGGNNYFAKIQSGNVGLLSNKSYVFNNGHFVRVITPQETFHMNYNNDIFIQDVLAKVEFKVLDSVFSNLLETTDLLKYIDNITINSNEKDVYLGFLLKNGDYSGNVEVNNITVNFLNNQTENHELTLPYIKSIDKLSVSSNKELKIYRSMGVEGAYEWIKVNELEFNGSFPKLTLCHIEIDGDYVLNLPETCLELDNSGNGFGMETPTIKVNGNLTIILPEGAIFAINMTEEIDSSSGKYVYSDFYANFMVSGKVVVKTNITLDEINSAYQKVIESGNYFGLTPKEMFAFKLYGLLNNRKAGSVEVELSAN